MLVPQPRVGVPVRMGLTRRRAALVPMPVMLVVHAPVLVRQLHVLVARGSGGG